MASPRALRGSIQLRTRELGVSVGLVDDVVGVLMQRVTEFFAPRTIVDFTLFEGSSCPSTGSLRLDLHAASGVRTFPLWIEKITMRLPVARS